MSAKKDRGGSRSSNSRGQTLDADDEGRTKTPGGSRVKSAKKGDTLSFQALAG